MKRTFENPIIGDVVHFVKYAQEPGGPDTVLDVDLKPGGGNALHYHRSFDEHFECLAGELQVQVGRQVRTLRPGDTATVPRGVHHRFFSTSSAPTRFRVTISPGHAGFENMLKIAYGMAADGLTDQRSTPKKFWQMGVAVHLSDTNVPGVLGLLMPLLRRAARRAMADGRYEREMAPYTLA
ncbi:cupin domain-containing protein [Hymenobacter sp. 15J16-1T3B]|uniref:cupin domain-containing protein n=1 Tax=Hymenobacter sp. 15J16-1T3B TaxID=2886941 RepID=UPI001D130660|nr:cupin domain-containing protein [Hymenobacter sp. 15J16-1T3B]MCC3156195.1 cupin domain-containing protein [Hymenobacter sp. 15J16-1T3B]